LRHSPLINDGFDLHSLHGALVGSGRSDKIEPDFDVDEVCSEFDDSVDPECCVKGGFEVCAGSTALLDVELQANVAKASKAILVNGDVALVSLSVIHGGTVLELDFDNNEISSGSLGNGTVLDFDNNADSSGFVDGDA
jgi:hypothetical protein